MLRCKLTLLRVLPPSRATNFHAAKSKSDVYFLQHENLLRDEVVIRATNNLNLQRYIVARQVARNYKGPPTWRISKISARIRAGLRFQLGFPNKSS